MNSCCSLLNRVKSSVTCFSIKSNVSFACSNSNSSVCPSRSSDDRRAWASLNLLNTSLVSLRRIGSCVGVPVSLGPRNEGEDEMPLPVFHFRICRMEYSISVCLLIANEDGGTLDNPICNDNRRRHLWAT